jgi:hypothetical protein
MYCPRCGQQASEEVRFCSRCGLPLDDASALVEAGGRLAPHEDTHEHARPLTPRQRGMRKGLLIMAGGLLFFVLALLLMMIKQDFFVLMLPAALVFTFGVMRMLYAMLLEDDAARRKSPKFAAAVVEHERTRAKLSRGAREAAAQLPHARTRPASDFAKSRADTADMASPPSVTEATTSLLEKDS